MRDTGDQGEQLGKLPEERDERLPQAGRAQVLGREQVCRASERYSEGLVTGTAADIFYLKISSPT